ncbi:PREDICTED: uncharacterized protein LOC107329342 [Acropora digitifera]|uniref:uncharacterized protein LOC107329342 n=1 Tax=Acropora digitifera TaxID=70779 RepID=UPI00077ABB41|nr:PREDICTED: uncharacterized protein LOC107329342 [Acropora digitifera]
MWCPCLGVLKNSESPETSIPVVTAVDRMDEKSSESKSKEGFESSIFPCTTSHGLNMRCVSLANHKMVPSNFKKLDFLESSKDAKQLFKKYAAERASEAIAEGRGKKNKGAPASLIAALGSNEEIYSVGADCGLFAAIFTAYSHHYKLRTSPDDWWFCVIKQVAEAIDRNAQQESVRKMFVDHEGKKSIEVPVNDLEIYTVNYSWLFDQIAKEIKENVKVPEFVDGMTGDFGTTTPVQRIVSQITLMCSMKEYFDFAMICGCGIPAVEIHHYKLRTSPDDWWFCVIKQVAEAIDRNAQQESVRKMFVDHEGKKSITVAVDDLNIYTVNYSWLFDQMAKGIKENVKVPEFVDGMTGDFGTTTPVQRIVSQITLMFSMKKYFDFKMILGCGIPAVEMLGSEEDWRKLTSKLKVLRTLLEPIENDLHLRSRWWDVVQEVFNNLLETYQGKPDKKWWSHIVDYQKEYSSGMYQYFERWFYHFSTNCAQMLIITRAR